MMIFCPQSDHCESSGPRHLSPNVAVLGFVSLFIGMASAMIYGLLPVFLVTILDADMASVGVIKGFAEATRRWQEPFCKSSSNQSTKY